MFCKFCVPQYSWVAFTNIAYIIFYNIDEERNIILSSSLREYKGVCSTDIHTYGRLGVLKCAYSI